MPLLISLPVPPNIEPGPLNKAVLENTSVTLECLASGVPPPGKTPSPVSPSSPSREEAEHPRPCSAHGGRLVTGRSQQAQALALFIPSLYSEKAKAQSFVLAAEPMPWGFYWHLLSPGASQGGQGSGPPRSVCLELFSRATVRRRDVGVGLRES